jgi:sugar lactone lactonase YvrE
MAVPRLTSAILLISSLSLWAAAAPQYTISTVAGSDQVGDGAAAILAQLAGAEGVAVDRGGNVYLADAIDHRVRKVNAAGIITTVAGNGHPGFKGDGGPASSAQLNSPYGLAVDPAGNLYIADLGNGRVRKVSTDGIISTIAGGGVSRAGAAGGDPLASKISPRNLAVAADGTLYLSDFSGHRIYQIGGDGRISVLVGTGVAGGANAEDALANATLNGPAGLALDGNGILHFADSGNNVVRKIEGGRVTVVLGADSAAAVLSAPTGLAIDASGTLYVVDSGNQRIWKRTAAGAASVLAATAGTAAAGGIPLEAPRDVAVDASGTLYTAARKRAQKISPAGVAAMLAGTGTFGYLGDGGAATEAHLFFPFAVALDGAGDLYIADQRNYRLRKVGPDGRITTVAGVGVQGSAGDGSMAAGAQLHTPAGVAVDATGRVWIGDEGAHRVRLAVPGGVIETVAGTGVRGYSGDGGPASKAQLFAPAGVAVDGAGNAYIADAANHRVRRITPTGIIQTYAGRGVRGYGGDGGPALEAQMDTPRALALDAQGNLYVSEYGNHAVRRITPEGRIETMAGTGVAGYAGDGGKAANANLNGPLGIAVDVFGNLLIADSENHRVRMVTGDGIIRTVAGDGVAGFEGDGGAATAARLYLPAGVAAGADGAVYVADVWNHRVRKLTPAAAETPEEPAAIVTEPTLDVVHGASLLAGPIAPGQIVAFWVPASRPGCPRHK